MFSNISDFHLQCRIMWQLTLGYLWSVFAMPPNLILTSHYQSKKKFHDLPTSSFLGVGHRSSCVILAESIILLPKRKSLPCTFDILSGMLTELYCCRILKHRNVRHRCGGCFVQKYCVSSPNSLEIVVIYNSITVCGVPNI